MPIQTIEPRRLYRQIADQVRGLIERGEYEPGARLPPERDLALQFGVSRPSVREALIALEIEGWVEVRMGSGVYVLRPDASRARRLVAAEGPLETIRARQMVEAALAAHAAVHMKKAQVAGLRNALALMQQEVDNGETPTRGDRLFHERIAEAAENSVLTRVVLGLYDERDNPLFEQLGSHFENADSWSAAIDEHQAVIAAIASRSPEAARAAMTAHLSNSHDRFTTSIAHAANGGNAGNAGNAAEAANATPPAPAARRRPARRAA
jgi:GntR family transcriptional regulator, transcriptional repressor for pyruvate dehydrogenase complex